MSNAPNDEIQRLHEAVHGTDSESAGLFECPAIPDETPERRSESVQNMEQGRLSWQSAGVVVRLAHRHDGSLIEDLRLTTAPMVGDVVETQAGTAVVKVRRIHHVDADGPHVTVLVRVMG